MKLELINHLLKYPISGTSRKFVNKYFNEKQASEMKLIMTLVVKNEEEIIENNIRFHCAMGVDGVIVISHNSTDKTNEILEKLKDEGLVLEIIYKKDIKHCHHKWVNEMIRLAKKKYNADWIINADADEFYYSKDLDLKKSIYEYAKCGINALQINSNFIFPSDDENADIYTNTDFVTKHFEKFEAECFNVPEVYHNYIGFDGCSDKIIHAVKGFISSTDGNHLIKMHNKKQVFAQNIRLYHYHIVSYTSYVEKVLRWIDSAKYMPKHQGMHVKQMIDLYKKGKLKEEFNNFYDRNFLNFLIKEGVVTTDKSVSNFLKYIVNNGHQKAQGKYLKKIIK